MLLNSLKKSCEEKKDERIKEDFSKKLKLKAMSLLDDYDI